MNNGPVRPNRQGPELEARVARTAPLEGKVALVAGATRGAGRGIARMLGAAGVVVYCTGRTSAGQASPMARPETIEETVALVDGAWRRRASRSAPDYYLARKHVAALVARIDADGDCRTSWSTTSGAAMR